MTDRARLDDLIAAARARGPMTADEIEAQRRSYVIAEIGMGSDSDEAAYRAAHARGDAAEMARLDDEAAKRVAAAKAILDGRPA